MMAENTQTDGLILDINLTGIDETIANIDGFPADLSRELSITMESSLQFLKGQVSDRAPRNTDVLAESINHQIISPFPNLVGSVGSPLPYAPVMEYGSDPYSDEPGRTMPPVDAINQWVVRKFGISGDEAESVAWAVAKNIAKHGLKGRFYFKEGLEASEPHIKTLFEGAVGRATARANGQ